MYPGNAVLRAQRRLQSRCRTRIGLDAEVAGQPLGGLIQVVEVIVVVVKEVPNLLVGQRCHRRVRITAAQPVIERLHAILEAPVGAVERKELPGKRRCRRGGEPQLGERR